MAGTISDEVQHYFDDYTYDDSDSYTEEDPYSDLQEVMPEEGELYEADLTAGIYKGGVHLPQGTYTLTCKSGSGQVELTDSKIISGCSTILVMTTIIRKKKSVTLKYFRDVM